MMGFITGPFYNWLFGYQVGRLFPVCPDNELVFVCCFNEVIFRICNPLRNHSANSPEAWRGLQEALSSRKGLAQPTALVAGRYIMCQNNQTDSQSKSFPMADFPARRTMMVDTQVRPSDVTKFPVIEAMLSVPKENYVPTSLREADYVGENIDLGDGRIVLEPRTFAKMLDVLNIQPDELLLEDRKSVV